MRLISHCHALFLVLTACLRDVKLASWTKGLTYGIAFSFALTISLCAQVVCPAAPVGGAADPSETTVLALYNKVLTDWPLCVSGTEAGCAPRIAELKTLDAAAKQIQATEVDCSLNGLQPAGTPLPGADKAYYAGRATNWLALVGELDPHVKLGSYQIPVSIQIQFLGIPAAPAPVTDPVPPTIAAKAFPFGTQQFVVKGQPPVGNYSSSTISICVWPAAPALGASLDCTGSKPGPVVLSKLKDGSQPTHTSLDSGGNATVSLATPLSMGEFVSVVEVSTLTSPVPAGPTTQTAVSANAYGVLAQGQCNKPSDKIKYSDCDLVFSIIGGVEQAGLASQPSTTDGFLRVFTRAGKNRGNSYVWGEIRLLSAPQQSSTTGVISAFSDPSGTIQTSTVSNVGNSVDYMIGVEQMLAKRSHGSYTASLLVGFGGTTPLSSTTVAQAFTSPAFGTVECNILYNKFASYFSNPLYGIIPGKANQATPTYPATVTSACLLNSNSPTTSNSSGLTTYAPITTIAFSNQDRNSFLAKYDFGVRTIDRFLQPGMKACGTADPANKIGPCQRGIVDFTIGQDASITGGQLRHWVAKVDGIHPLPIKGTSYLYLFGSFSMRFEHNVNETPLILQTGSLSTITGSGSTAVPNINTVVLPLVQPDRDFYRFGVGLDISCILTKVFSSSSNCSSQPTPPTGGS